MKLDNMEITNYRQFKGEQKIKFSTDSDKRVTIMHGKIGTGKTFILDALRWCLYGEEHHPRKDEEPILNTHVLRNLKKGGTESVKVVINFSEAGAPKYKVTRKVTVKKTDGSPKKVSEDLNALEMTGSGTEHRDPVPMVRKFLPKKIHQFFLFAGEDIVEYFTEESEKSVKEAVTNISQIDLLEEVIKHEDHFLKVLSRQTKDVAELDKIDPRLEDLEEKIQKKEKEWKELDESIKTTEKEIRSINAKLGDLSPNKGKEYGNELKKLDKNHAHIKEKIEDLRSNLSEEILELGVRTHLKEAVENVLPKLEEKEGLPPYIQDIYIDSLIEKGRCICKRPLKGEALEAVKDLKEKEAGGKAEILGLEGKYGLSGAKKRLEKGLKEIKKLREEISKEEEELDRVGSRAKTVKEKIELAGEEDLTELVARQDKLKSLKIKAVGKRGEVKENVRKMDKEVEKLKKKRSRLVRKRTQNKEIANLYELFEDAQKLAEKVKEEVLDEVRKEAEKETDRIFQRIHWKDTYEGLEISPHFVVTPKKQDGWEGGALSGGERTVLALSFVAGLQKITGFDFPIVMDSPLAQWSGEPRKDFAELLDEYTPGKQLVFLLKDTEYTDDLRNVISKYVGKEYELEFNEDTSSTEIKEV